MISDAAQSSRLDRQEAEHKELLGKVEGLEAADVYLQVSFFLLSTHKTESLQEMECLFPNLLVSKP